LQVRLRGKFPRTKQFYVAMNPISKNNWTYRRWFSKDSVIPSDTIVMKSTFRDNKFLSESDAVMYSNMKKTNYKKWQIMANGEFVNDGKLIYENVVVEAFDEHQLRKDGLKPKFGLDYGYMADESSFCYLLIDEKNMKIYFADEMYEKAMSNREIAKWITKNGYSKEVIIADSSEPKSNDELRRLGITRLKSARKGKDSVLNGIQFIQNFQIIVHPSCVNALNEFENYTWKKDRQTGLYTNKPIDSYSHLMDAMRYGMQDMMRQTKLRSFNKGFLGL